MRKVIGAIAFIFVCLCVDHVFAQDYIRATSSVSVSELPDVITMQVEAVPTGSNIAFCVSLKNATNKSLEIVDIKPSCSCMEVEVDDLELGSGQTTELRFGMKGKSRTSTVRQKLDIYFAGHPEEPMSVQVEAKFVGVVSFDSDRLSFSKSVPKVEFPFQVQEGWLVENVESLHGIVKLEGLSKTSMVISSTDGIGTRLDSLRWVQSRLVDVFASLTQSSNVGRH
jgi:hypothetical protein